MAEKKSKPPEPESGEFKTQKIDREELMAEFAEQKPAVEATQKIDDVALEAATSQKAMDSGATMKVSEAELKKAMDEELNKAKTPASPPPQKEPPLSGEVVDKPAPGGQGASSSARINPTVAAIIGVAIVLAACICGCFLLAAVYFYRTGF